MKIGRFLKAAVSLLLVFAAVLNFAGCAETARAAELTAGIKAGNAQGKSPDSDFTSAQMKLYAELFAAGVKSRENENVFLSPLSLHIALALAANGAEGETKAQLEKLLGGGMSVQELNKYLYYYVKSLPAGDGYKTDIASSLWICDKKGLDVKADFLQNCCDYYSAQVFKAPFDSGTVNDMNAWVYDHTDSMIEKIVEKLDSETVLSIINAVVFNARWEEPYEPTDVTEDSFTDVNGYSRRVKMMCSDESVYLSDGTAVGFIKDYKDGKYAFAALLPEREVNIYDYAASLDGEKLFKILSNSEKTENLMVKIPKFSCEYSASFRDALSEMGIADAFDSEKADFTPMAEYSGGNICIGDVFHKAFISVDESGTKAGAATKVDMDAASAPAEIKQVFLDRPFVFMIIDKSCNIPIFMGVAGSIQPQ